MRKLDSALLIIIGISSLIVSVYLSDFYYSGLVNLQDSIVFMGGYRIILLAGWGCFALALGLYSVHNPKILGEEPKVKRTRDQFWDRVQLNIMVRIILFLLFVLFLYYQVI